MGAAVEAAYRPTADEKRESGGKAGGVKAGKGRPDRDRGTSPKPKQDESTRTTSVAAAAVGMDRRTYEKAKEVVASKDAKLMAEMNKSGKVSVGWKPSGCSHARRFLPTSPVTSRNWRRS